MQIWPRKRARRMYARISSWERGATNKLLSFPGYKAGMTHVMMKESNPNATFKGMAIACPVTVIECPPVKVFALRFYQSTPDGTKLISQIFSTKLDKELERKIGHLPKKNGKEPEQFSDLRLVVYTQPKLVGFGKKKPEVMEVGIGGVDDKSRLAFAKQLLDKEIRVSEVFTEGQFVDSHSITKGKGFQGTVKRYGVKIRQHKAEKTKRGIGTLGSWHPNRVEYTVAQPGKMGNHQRTEFNKRILKIADKPETINPAGGFLRYGLVKNDYILIKGSVGGPTKRLITLAEPRRAPLKLKLAPPQLSYISLSSKQKR